MSYSSLSELIAKTNIKDISEFIELLGYTYSGVIHSDEVGELREYFWFDEDDYKSWSGVELSIYKNEGLIFVETRTPIGRSYFDLEQQNKTIRLLRKYFGGSFKTDEGKGRYLQPRTAPPTPVASGCHLAFQRFGSNLMTGHIYFMNRNFKGPQMKPSGHYMFDKMNPWLISNNLLLPFLVSIFEDYWKSTYIALLRYSRKKESLFKSGRISSDRLAAVSESHTSMEQAFAETLSFQRIGVVCSHLKVLDPNLDFATVLRKPYRRRNTSLFDSLEQMTELRHKVIHRAEINDQVTEDYTKGLFHNLEVSIIKCYQHLTKSHGWFYDKWWGGTVK
jgi:hypothetical protein